MRKKINYRYDKIKISTKSLSYKIQRWRCIHCPCGASFNDCFDFDCSFWIWFQIKFREWKRKRKNKIGHNSNNNVIIQNSVVNGVYYA